MPTYTDVATARRAYLKADAAYGKACTRHRRFGWPKTKKAMEEARSVARARWADLLDAEATAGITR